MYFSLSNIGRPEILSLGMTLTLSRGDNVTMDCQFTSNPLQRVYKWHLLRTSDSILLNESNNHYTVTPNTLSIYNITPDDANAYICNVTNQCGSATVAYNLEVIGKFIQVTYSPCNVWDSVPKTAKIHNQYLW